MEVVCTVDCCAAKIENIIAFDKEIDILESDLFGVVVPAVDQVSA